MATFDELLDKVRSGKISSEEAISMAKAPCAPPTHPTGAPPHRWPDADDFSRETAGKDVCHIERIDYSNDYAFVLNQVNGVIYRLTFTQMIALGLGGYKTGEQWTLNHGKIIIGKHRPMAFDPANFDRATEQETWTHIMQLGSPMCRFTNERFVDWPKGHFWVSLDHVKNIPQGERSGVTCDGCFNAYRQHLADSA